MKITTKQARAAREYLGLSQAAVCKGTGISRNIMSAFEQKKIVLGDEMQDRLRNYFVEKGAEIPEPDAVDVPSSDQPDHRSTLSTIVEDRDFQIIEGFCVPAGLSRDAVEDLFAELEEVEEEIDELRLRECAGGIIGRYSDTCDAEFERLLLLCAQWRDMVLAIHGHEMDFKADQEGVPRTLSGRITEAAQNLGLATG